MKFTSISLPLSTVNGKTADGYSIANIAWIGGIPAVITNASRSEKVAAMQLGYDADITVKIDASNYAGQSFLKDDANGVEYDISRISEIDGGKTLLLICSCRTGGNGVPGWL